VYIVLRNISHCTRKLVQYDILLGTIFTNIHAITLQYCRFLSYFTARCTSLYYYNLYNLYYEEIPRKCKRNPLDRLWLYFYWQHICYLWWTCFSTDSRHTYGYKLCSSSRRLVPLFVWGRLHTGASQEKLEETSPILWFHVLLYRWCPFTK
jgi:hypothetical protein